LYCTSNQISAFKSRSKNGRGYFFPKRRGKDKFIRGLDGEKLKEIENLESLDLHGTIILKFTLNKIRGRGLEFFWLRIDASEHRNDPSRPIKCEGFLSSSGTISFSVMTPLHGDV